MKVFIASLVLLLSVAVDGRSVGRKPLLVGCIFGLNQDLPKKNEPLLLVRSQKALTLAMPETSGKFGTVSLRQGEELVVACPGNKNTLVKANGDVVSTTCSRDNVVDIGKNSVKISDLDCKSRAAGSLVNTGKSCAGGKGTIVDIGFKVENWHKLIETCHNNADSLTYYATHTVYGSSLNGKVIQSFRPGFSRGDKAFFLGLDPDKLYNQNNQQAVFEEMFGAKLAAKYLDNKSSFFLARGHLAPDADFLFGTWQLATYFFINVAPQWQSINAGHWLAVENNVRKLAISLGADLDVATGTYGVMTLPDAKGKEKEVYLSKGRVPVPELYWKVIHNPQDDSCMGIISTNNPFIPSPPDHLCQDICAQYNWPELQSDLTKGYVYCCKYADLKKAIKNVPDYKCKSVLTFEK